MATSTLSDEALGRMKPDKKVVAYRFDRAFEPTPANVLGTSTPAGIVEHDPDVVKNEPVKADPLASVVPKHQSPAAASMPSVSGPYINHIELHPAQPRQSYDEAELQALADDIARNGLISPVMVRPHPTKAHLQHYQLVCGHRRLLACKRLKWTAIPVIVKQLSDVETLRILASENAHRKDLNPIEEALMLETLTKPTAAGGGGMTDAEASALYGHTETWATNKKRLLALPEPWRARLLSGEIEETKARALLPYIVSPRVMKAIDDEWKEAGAYNALQSLNREAFTEELEGLVENQTFGVNNTSKKTWHRGGKGSWDHVPCYVDLEANREALGIVKIPIRKGYGPKAKVVNEERVTNLDLLYKLQWAAMEKRKKNKDGKADKAEAKAKAKAEKKTLTPAQLKAKRAEADRVLGERIKKWKFAVKRFYIAQTLKNPAMAQGELVDRLLLYWGLFGGNHGYQRSAIRTGVGNSASVKRELEDDRQGGVWGGLAKVGDVTLAIACAAAEYFWPTFEDAYDVDTWRVAEPVVEAFCGEIGFDFEDQWRDLQEDNPAGGALLFSKFLSLFNGEQLAELAMEWDVFIPDGMAKSKAIDKIQAQLTTKRLKLPSGLKEKGSGKQGSGAGSQAPGKKAKPNRKAAKAGN